jgi:hypothetical protein
MSSHEKGNRRAFLRATTVASLGGVPASKAQTDPSRASADSQNGRMVEVERSFRRMQGDCRGRAQTARDLAPAADVGVPAGRPIYLRFKLDQAKLFSLDFA